MSNHGHHGWLLRNRRWLIAVLVVGMLVALVLALLGPWSGVFIRMSLPRQHGDLQVMDYRRGGPPPPAVDGIRFSLPAEAAHAWFMAAVGHVLPAAVAEPGSVVWGEVRGPAVGTPLPVHVVSHAPGTAPRVDLTLTVARVNAWLVEAAKRDGSAWVARLDAGSRISDAEMAAPPGWDLHLRVMLSGLAARRDGQPGLVRLESFDGVIDLRWYPGVNDTRVEAQVRLERLRVKDERSEFAGEVPTVVLDLVAQAINAGLRAQPPLLPFVVPRDARLSVEVVAGSPGPSPAF